MSNVQSYNALIDRFKAFASGHFILKTFSHGQIDTADLEKFTEYPFMHVVPSNVTYAKGTKTFSFQIVLADLPRDKDDKVEFQREVLSDLQRIAEDLVAEITNHRVLFGDLITVQNVSLEPFLEEFHNTLTGWTVSLELLVPYYWDACSIPAEWNDFFESGSGGTGSILTFIDSITRDENGNVSLVNDEAEPAPNYYYGTNDEGVRGWYLLTDEVGLTCETIGSCQTIIDIESAIDDLQEEILLKANTADLGAVAFSNSYNDLDNLPTLPTGTVTSVGLTMPSAFSVANSPITSSGDIAVTGAGTVSQYVRGDGSLANFPSSTGGGASLSFYLNGSVAQGTFGGVAFKEMDRTPIFGAGTDFTINANGYIQSFITDANVPNLLEIPAGNWNFETYFSASSNGGSPSFYVELYKWDGATLSLIASNSATPEGITNGTAIDLYVSALAIPQTTLAATDRLAVRIYVTHSGRTIKLHTENSHLCQVITTFSTGLTALNGLTAQVQNFATGTSGTDFAISSATSTHTFNLPTASAANRGALSSADWTTFNGKFNLPALTSGSVLFSNGTTIAQDNANLFYDDTNNRLGVGTNAPNGVLDLTSTTQGLLIPRMTTTQRNAISSPANGLQIYNTTEGYIEYYDSFWGWIPLGNQNEWKRKWGSEYFNDFGVNNAFTGDGVFQTFPINGGAANLSSGAPSTTNFIGYQGLSTGLLANGQSAIRTDLNFGRFWYLGNRLSFISRIWIPVLSDATNRYNVLFGISIGANSTVNTGCAFIYDEGGVGTGTTASPNWQIITAASSVRTNFVTSVAVVVNTWYSFRIESNSTCTEIYYYINDVLVRTETTNIPTNTFAALPIVSITKNVGLTNRVMAVDYLGYKMKFNSAR